MNLYLEIENMKREARRVALSMWRDRWSLLSLVVGIALAWWLLPDPSWTIRELEWLNR